MDYSSFYETSNICPGIVGEGARETQSGAASRETFVMRRCQILLASAGGLSPPR